MRLINICYGEDNGSAFVEYCLIVSLIALAAITAITSVGTKVSTVITSIAAV